MDASKGSTKARRRCRRWTVGLISGCAVFGATYAMAAGRPPGPFGSGEMSITSCQREAVDVSFADRYEGPGRTAVDVTVDNIDASSTGCGGQTLRLQLQTTSAVASRAAQESEVTSSVMMLSFPGVDAADVTSVRVSIGGAR